ncbi:MAG: hypothetical protein DVB31_02525 [Verrucomicrobia bacterium]|nr:MAG: hypothetical protein DVB31_02525 [Verrucomicrobiota bacterium]
MRAIPRRWLSILLLAALCVAAAGLLAFVIPSLMAPGPAIVVYCAQDQAFAEPLLGEFAMATGIRVRPVWDSEMVKTVGLANRLLGESQSPRAHVWWSNEELRTRQLAARGVFGTNRIGPDGLPFLSFGCRHRCMVFDPGHRPSTVLPRSLVELTNARFAGRVSIAFPLFGTTATHLLALRDAWGDAAWRDWCRAFAANRPFLEEGNSHVAGRVARGEAWIGLTDSDDLAAAIRGGMRLAEIPLGRDGMAIPNTVALVRSAPADAPARRFAGYLASDAVVARFGALGAIDAAGTVATGGLVPDWNRMLATLDVATVELEGIFRR